MWELGLILLYIVIIPLTAYRFPTRRVGCFLFAIINIVFIFGQTKFFAPLLAALAVATIIHNMIVQRNEPLNDDCASFKWSELTSHCTCTMICLMGSYVSMFAL